MYIRKIQNGKWNQCVRQYQFTTNEKEEQTLVQTAEFNKGKVILNCKNIYKKKEIIRK